jgi:hypothetical protein
LTKDAPPPTPAPAPVPPAPPSPSPSPGQGDYLCYAGKCYEKPGYGKMDKDTCQSTCSKSDGFVV